MLLGIGWGILLLLIMLDIWFLLGASLRLRQEAQAYFNATSAMLNTVLEDALKQQVAGKAMHMDLIKLSQLITVDIKTNEKAVNQVAKLISALQASNEKALHDAVLMASQKLGQA